MRSYDVVVVGGGIVGLVFACALAQQTRLSIAIIEAAQTEKPASQAAYHHRVSAIALSSYRVFQMLDVWDAIKSKRVSPFTGIHVWDEATAAAIQFTSAEIAESVLGYVIENSVIQAALMEKIQLYPNIHYLAPLKLATFQRDNEKVTFITEAGDVLQAQLAVAADGAKSWLRQQAGIAIEKEDYEQQAIVATVRTHLSHEQIARQIFLTTGPLAFLPLKEAHTSSIVWSLPTSEAKRILALPEEAFKSELTAAFKYKTALKLKTVEGDEVYLKEAPLGEIVVTDQRYTFPLYKQQAQNYVRSRLALIGDAAHAIHPLAGQGLNLGLLDAISLAKVITTAWQQQRNIGSLSTLRRYERWRRADNLPMMAGVDWIKQLFASQHSSVKFLRSLGLNFTNRFSFIKNLFTRHAVGKPMID